MDLPELKYNEAGLIPCIVQDADTGEVLMMAWMSAESLALTLERGETVFWSRSRRELWHKGATSGNTQKLVDLRYDCDADTLLALVHPAGPACHTGERTCFYRSMLESSRLVCSRFCARRAKVRGVAYFSSNDAGWTSNCVIFANCSSKLEKLDPARLGHAGCGARPRGAGRDAGRARGARRRGASGVAGQPAASRAPRRAARRR